MLSMRNMAKAHDYLSMCPQERFSLYKFSCQAYPLLKRIGPPAAPQHHLLCLLLSYCFLYRKPLKNYLSVLAVIPCPKSLINTFRSSLGSTLLLFENAAIDPLRLWVIKYRFLAPLPRSIALLVSEAGKEIFILLLFLFCSCCSLSIWTTYLLDRCLRGNTPHLWWLFLPLMKLYLIKYQLVLSIVFWL